MIRLALVLLVLSGPAVARCPDILIGDSHAVGMAPYARIAGFEVIAQSGGGLAWFRRQEPRCAGRLVLALGTNDLRGIRTDTEAARYAQDVRAQLGRWTAERAIWATPGCFPRHPGMDLGSASLERVLWASEGIDHGRPERCGQMMGDGVHPYASGYRAWWAGIWGRI